MERQQKALLIKKWQDEFLVLPFSRLVHSDLGT
jgi:hypothetical protein